MTLAPAPGLPAAAAAAVQPTDSTATDVLILVARDNRFFRMDRRCYAREKSASPPPPSCPAAVRQPLRRFEARLPR